jgi:hypothetical protein
MRLNRYFFAGVLLAAPAAAFGYSRVGFGFNFGFPLFDYPAPTRVVVVPQPAATEMVPPAPGPDYVWIPGRWEWDTAGKRWMWYGGTWQRPPAPNAVWQAGYWSQQGPGWSWISAHWMVPNAAPVATGAPSGPPPPPETAPAPIDATAPAPEMIVNEAPPAPLVEEIYAAPGPDYVWVGGAWAWHSAWVWAPGHYVLPPHRGAVWVSGAWGARGRGWGWSGGHWR